MKCRSRYALGVFHLDLVAVLLLDGDDWKAQAVQASYPRATSTVFTPRPIVLATLLLKKCAVWQTPRQDEGADWSSIQDIDAVVAAPILDPKGDVVGAIYGERTVTSLPTEQQIKLESMLLGIIASLVGTRLKDI